MSNYPIIDNILISHSTTIDGTPRRHSTVVLWMLVDGKGIEILTYIVIVALVIKMKLHLRVKVRRVFSSLMKISRPSLIFSFLILSHHHTERFIWLEFKKSFSFSSKPVRICI